jgi:hypothetical protein
MNSHLNTHRVTGIIEDRIRAAAEARLLPEYRSEPTRTPKAAARRAFPRLRLAWTVRRHP